jgi:hypothetical protein
MRKEAGWAGRCPAAATACKDAPAMASRCGRLATSRGVLKPNWGMDTSPTPSISTNATRSGSPAIIRSPGQIHSPCTVTYICLIYETLATGWLESPSLAQHDDEVAVWVLRVGDSSMPVRSPVIDQSPNSIDREILAVAPLVCVAVLQPNDAGSVCAPPAGPQGLCGPEGVPEPLQPRAACGACLRHPAEAG